MSPLYRGGVRITGGFWLLIAWFALVNGWKMLVTVLCAAAVHECGHLAVLRWNRAKIMGLRISVFGAELETDSGSLSYGGELAAVLAGPAANLLCASVLLLLGGRRFWILAGANLALCAFNLLPIRRLDGGRAFYLLVAWAAGPAAGEWAARYLGAFSAAALASCLVWLMWRSGGSLWLAPAACGLLASALGDIAAPIPGKREKQAIFAK